MSAIAPALRVPLSACTLAGFRAWTLSAGFPAHGNIAFVGHEIFIDRSPERIESHNKVKTEITRVLATIVKRDQLGDLHSDRTRLVNEAAGVSNEPDVLFVSYTSQRQGRVRIVPLEDDSGDYLELVGSPDCVVEIVSPSSVEKDTVRLREAYHRADIREYWLIDALSDAIVFQILAHEPGGYAEVSASRGGWVASAVFRRRFRLVRALDPLQRWDYTLAAKRR